MPGDESGLSFLTLAQAASLVKRGKVSPVELTRNILSRIERLNPLLNAFLLVSARQAMRDALRAERQIMRGDYLGSLHGIPVCLKDNFWTRGIRTTAGSRIMRNFVPRVDSDVATRLRRAGAILLGKTNMHEFAYGVTSVNPHHGWVRNPWDLRRISGGSSGGSAAALAAGLAYGSVGTDTGGSIRNPAAFCGIVGMKPTYGLVSLDGVVPLAASMDHAGPMARTVQDAALLLDVIAGRRSFSVGDFMKAFSPGRYSAGLRAKRSGFKVGWPVRGYFGRATPEIMGAIRRAALVLNDCGAHLAPVSLKGAESILPSANVAARVEAAAWHVQMGYFPSRSREYGTDVRQHLVAGTRISAVEYLRAQSARTSLRRIFDAVFKSVDVILAPTLPAGAPLRAQDSLELARGEETVRSALIRFSRLPNFAGLPAISVPCGFTSAGLPVGLQLIGPPGADAMVLRIAWLYEQATKWHTMHPVL